MEPLTVGFFALNVLLLGYDRLKKKDGTAAEVRSGPEPMIFTPAAVAKFTDMRAGVRHFAPMAQRGIRADLALRSVIPQSVPPHVQGKASAFRVVPMIPGADLTAAAVVARAAGQGATVLGSLSLVGLMSGIDTSFVLLLTNADGARELAPERDQTGMPAAWAILAEPAPRAEKPAPAPPPPAPEAPAPDIKPPAPIDTSRFERVPLNGAPKPAPSAPEPPISPSSSEGA